MKKNKSTKKGKRKGFLSLLPVPKSAAQFIENLRKIIYERPPNSWMGVLAVGVNQTYGCLVQEALGGPKKCKDNTTSREVLCGYGDLAKRVPWLESDEVCALIASSDHGDLARATTTYKELFRKYVSKEEDIPTVRRLA